MDEPDAAAIRRALAECMTADDIDEAMGWRPGTARRRRWMDLAAGGIPPADAAIGGVPLWFRATITRWRAGTADAPPTGARRTRRAAGAAAGAGEPDAGTGREPDVSAGASGERAAARLDPAGERAADDSGDPRSGAPGPSDPEPVAGSEVAGRDSTGPDGAGPAVTGPEIGEPEGTAREGARSRKAPSEQSQPVVAEPEVAEPEVAVPGVPASEETAAEPCGRASTEPDPTEPGVPAPESPGPESPEPDSPRPQPEPGTPDGAEPAEGAPGEPGIGAAGTPRSGFELDEGQAVFVLVRGTWRSAVVRSRARRTAVVGYRIADGPLGAREQRVTIERIRVPAD